MPIAERFAHDIDHPVDQQERIAVRDRVHDALDIDHLDRASPARCVCGRGRESIDVQSVSCLRRPKPCPSAACHRLADQRRSDATSRKNVSHRLRRAARPHRRPAAHRPSRRPARRCAPACRSADVRQPRLAADHDVIFQNRGTGNADLRHDHASRGRGARCARSARGYRGANRRRSRVSCNRAAVDRGVGADLDVVLDHHAAELRHR